MCTLTKKEEIEMEPEHPCGRQDDDEQIRNVYLLKIVFHFIC